MNKIILDQLAKVKEADLSNFNEETLTYTIPKKVEIKLEEDKNYLIQLKDTFYQDNVLKQNWNNNCDNPKYSYMVVCINKIAANVVNITGVGYDIMNHNLTQSVWTGWVKKDEMNILERR